MMENKGKCTSHVGKRSFRSNVRVCLKGSDNVLGSVYYCAVKKILCTPFAFQSRFEILIYLWVVLSYSLIRNHSFIVFYYVALYF